MNITIYHNELQDHIVDMLDNDEFESVSIDYMFNAIMGWKDGEEITIYDFTPILKLDNRFSDYELELNYGNITIDFITSQR